jgi:hypothetical protein
VTGIPTATRPTALLPGAPLRENSSISLSLDVSGKSPYTGLIGTESALKSLETPADAQGFNATGFRRRVRASKTVNPNVAECR